MKHTLTAQKLNDIRARLTDANSHFVTTYPGLSGGRQPVHTVYGGAQLFTATTARKMSETAVRTLQEYAPEPTILAKALGVESTESKLLETIYSRVLEKLKKEAVEDFRIDFEDGYGNRPQAEEDGHAESAALEVAKGMESQSLPPFIGIRIKPFNEENVARSLRTLDIFVSTLSHATGGKLPDNFVVTLPKITITEQSRALAEALARLEEANGLASGTLKYELMVETPQSILSADGRCPLREFVDVSQGRCVGAHFGTYDYTAGTNITAAYQTMDNPVCDFAKHMMQVSLAGTNVMLSDGATNIMPVGPHRAAAGQTLSAREREENREVVHRAWALSYRHIRHSLATGFYQGWDLHPAQLPVRYAAVYAFFLEGFDSAAQRLRAFIEKAAKATLLGDVFDDAATGQGLLNYFLRALSCGAITEAEAESTGLTLAEIRSRSFLKILEGRKIV